MKTKFVELLIVSDIKNFYISINKPTIFIDIIETKFEQIDEIDKINNIENQFQIQVQFDLNLELYHEYLERKKQNKYILHIIN